MVAEKLTPLAEVYSAICSVTKSCPQFIRPINDFVKARHGALNIAVFQATKGIEEDAKRETYKAIVDAINADAMDRLAPAKPAVEKPSGRVDLVTLVPPATVELVDEPVVAKPVIQKQERMLPAEDDEEEEDKLVQFQRLLNELVKPKSAPLDHKAVADIVGKQLSEYDIALKKELIAQLDELAKRGGGTTKLEVQIGGATNVVEGLTHCQLPQVVTWVAANVPVWLWGKAGGGKTHLFYQVAAALGIKPYVVSIDPTTTINKLLGYRNLATGEFVEGLAYAAYKHGGLFAPDEIDTGDPGVIAGLNAMLANGHFMFPNGELVERHKDFRVLVGANTKGTGAVAGYTARQRLDAATLDRFAVIEFGYDEGLELALCCGGESTTARWKPIAPATEGGCRQYVEWVQKIRKAAGDAVLISPRASYHGVRALRSGIQPSEVVEALVFKLVAPDTRSRLVSQVGMLPAM